MLLRPFIRINIFEPRKCQTRDFRLFTANNKANKPKYPSQTKAMLKQTLQYVWPKDRPNLKRRVLISVGLLIAGKCIAVQAPILFKKCIDFLNDSATVELADGTKKKILNLDSPKDTVLAISITLILGYGAARIGSSFFNELRNAVFARVATDSIRRVSISIFSHLLKLDHGYHLNRQTGSLSKAIDRGSRGINFLLSSLVFNVVPTAFEIALVSSILYYQCGGKFALVTLGCISSYAAFTFAFTRWRTKFRVQMNEAESNAGSKSVDALINFETVKLFNNIQHETKQYEIDLKTYQDASLKTNTSLAALNFGQQAIFGSAITWLMLMSAEQICTGQTSVGDMVMVNGLLFQLQAPLNFLGTVYREVRQSLTDMEAMFKLMTVKSGLNIIQDAPKLILSPTTASLVFDNVSFGYNNDRLVINKLSFEVASGKKIAIVGGSGCGKSTIVRLLYRFYDPFEGAVYINNQNIRNVDLESLQKHIAIVPQDSVLFDNTIMYNIRYGNFEASLDKVASACQLAELHESVLTWPNQYETRVGERGLKLSGGEKQRVAIARAMLKNSPILVFDEATSSLDSITEAKIMTAIQRAVENRTSVRIAHRLGTVIDADEILVLSGGQIVERGTHRSLLARPSSFYSLLWHQQQQSKLDSNNKASEKS